MSTRLELLAADIALGKILPSAKKKAGVKSTPAHSE
jgi:hypothetical protein